MYEIITPWWLHVWDHYTMVITCTRSLHHGDYMYEIITPWWLHVWDHYTMVITCMRSLHHGDYMYEVITPWWLHVRDHYTMVITPYEIITPWWLHVWDHYTMVITFCDYIPRSCNGSRTEEAVRKEIQELEDLMQGNNWITVWPFLGCPSIHLSVLPPITL